MNFSVLQFPASNCDQDAVHALRHLGHAARLVWHKDASLGDADCVIVPGGFSYGDYLRCGAIARFSPVMQAVQRHAADGGPVLGICNGFQILCEAGLLPGALLRNASLKFICDDVLVEVGGAETPVTAGLRGARLRMPVAHADGNYHADAETLDRLEGEGRVVFRYVGGAPNGAARDIAGIAGGPRMNVVGLMPHPERSSEALLGCSDGRKVFESLLGAA